ncbi:molybdate ABC transporter substrate-binding protein [Arsenicibacter rosenii]|uniref:Molybdate ABC transporter substrate-binding protein n=1 Tax=Arsenicibacter rosenii TaxID=1750698 RepID=A0A1S2VQL8_9BACT|nr:molybdate ABC transporter substrate-binding protein [Arsenicibacter rosenii]OIN61061.1 molybdate ABC transporter substrate-binding protein [Arsenicibacter rosenii]
MNHSVRSGCPRFLLLICGLLLSAITDLSAQELRIAVAANAQFVMETLRDAFQKQTGISVTPIVSSSGKLTTQIQQGAPYDLFLSADTDYPETLFKAGLTTGTPFIYAYGSLVLWAPDKPQLKRLHQLTARSVRHIAIANPATAPYGQAAVSLLKYHKLWDALQPKMVYGESIAQVNQYITSGAAEAGFTAKSVVMAPNAKGYWMDVPPPGYAPIAQGVVILKRTQSLKAARQFIQFLRSSTGRRILQQYGYRFSAS